MAVLTVGRHLDGPRPGTAARWARSAGDRRDVRQFALTSERAALENFLDAQREGMIGKIQGAR